MASEPETWTRGCVRLVPGEFLASVPGGVDWRQAAIAASANTQNRRTPCGTLPPMVIKDALLAEYDHEMGTTRRLLERVPEDRLSWKPHERSMSMAGLATHLGNIPHWADTILTQPFFDLADAPPNLEPKG